MNSNSDTQMKQMKRLKLNNFFDCHTEDDFLTLHWFNGTQKDRSKMWMCDRKAIKWIDLETRLQLLQDYNSMEIKIEKASKQKRMNEWASKQHSEKTRKKISVKNLDRSLTCY